MVSFQRPMTQGGEETGWVTADEYLSGNVREKLPWQNWLRFLILPLR